MVFPEQPNKSKNIESIYPLSPMQEGMLFHSLYEPDSGVYFEQFSFTVHGNLDISAFELAWCQVVDRHPVLRTLFVWKNRTKQLQVVCKSINLPWTNLDWRELSPVEQEEQLEVFKQVDKNKGFELDKAPLIRFVLIQVANNTYKFVWSFHHLLMDGWCIPIIFKEVFAFYEAGKRGFDLHLPPTRPYSDYIAWLQQQDNSKAITYWQDALKGFSAPTPLVVDRTVGPNSQQKKIYLEHDLRLSVTTTATLKLLAQKHNITLSTFVQGAWALLLSQYSGEEDVVFGATVSGRPPVLSGVESMVGLFINTLPVRVQVEKETELLPWLIQLQQQQVEREEYSYYSLSKIQQLSEIPPGSSLFKSIVVFENYSVGDSLFSPPDGLQIDNLQVIERTNYPLTLVVMPEWELLIQISYDGNRFNGDTIVRMGGHLLTLLEGMVATEQQKLKDLPLLTEGERHQILVEWNNTTKEYPKDQCIHQLFEEQVERAPDAIAVVFEGEQLTYKELNKQANRIAHYLKNLGVGPEVLVGICVERSLEMVVGLLGILKAGGAYVPLDPSYPTERLRYILDDTDVQVLLTQTGLVSSVPKHNVPVVCLDTLEPEIARLNETNCISGVTPDNLAYVIYTSGSTGKPKGVMNTHQGVGNRLLWMQETYQLTVADRILQKTPFSFDVSVWELFWPLLSGARLVVAQPGGHQDSVYLLNLILEQQITTLHFVPSMLQVFLEEPGLERCSCLKRTFCSGEALPKKLQERFFARLGGELHNLYGPTEAAIDVTFWQCQAESTLTTVPIGRPIANTQIYILDPELQPVPVGVAGELHIGGEGLARGYLNRPDLTAEKFIPNPFENQPGARLYKSGDLARFLDDGNIEFLGRIDNQVKIRGFRIELGEIESLLANHPQVQQTAVIVREDIPGDKHLVAYFVPNQPLSDLNELRRFLQQQLPDYMVPSAFVMLSALPVTPNGKLNRRALPKPELQPELKLTFVAPRTPIEDILANIWASVLRIEQVGVHNNFFELGGHSLLATQVMSRVRDSLAVELQLRSLFEAPTVAELAKYIERAISHRQPTETPPLLSIPRSAEIPLSFAQTRLWFLYQLQPNSAFYNSAIALRLSGQLNVMALEKSLKTIIDRHETLRTNFTTVEGQPVQVIASNLNLKLKIVNLLDIPESDREVQMQRLANIEAVQPFDLEHEPLVRVTLLQLGEVEHVFVLTLHHIICDGWSLGVLYKELATIYETLCTDKAPVLPQLPIQYADFAVWQRRWLQGEVLQAHLDYWKQQLKDAPALLELPTDRPRPVIQTYQGGYRSLALSKELSEDIALFSRRAGATLFMTLLAAFGTLLYRYTGQDDICIGTPIANRNRREIEGLIGFFVNTLVLRTDLSGNPSFKQLLSRVKEVALQAYAHQDLPFEELVEVLQPERSLSHTPLFQVMFALQNAPMLSLALPDLTVSSLTIQTGTATFDLTLSMQNTSEGLIAEWEYNSDLFDDLTIARMARHFQTLLEAIVGNPQQPVSALPLLTEAERHQLLFEWNNTQTEYPQDKCIHQLFEEQVELRPDAVAVIFEGEKLTYQELNARANQLAHYLQTLGVGLEVLVGICVERSLWTIIGLLGILKAGGAYVPLDPEYPTERLSFMLEDTAVQVLLTQEKLVKSLPKSQAHVLCLDSDWLFTCQWSQENPITNVQATNLAYVIYTSGSTGRPKGVLIPHGAIANHCCIIQQTYELVHSDRVLQFASVNFDASLEQIFPTLVVGATLVLRGSDIWTPRKFQKIISDFGLTVVNLPTAYWQQLAQEWVKTQILDANSQLRLMIVGGDVMLPSDVALWQQSPMSGVRLLNAYGPTEATITATLFEIPPQLNLDTNLKKITIGCPVPNKTVYILDNHLQPVPIGVPGELHIGGVGLARGYLNRPEITLEKFICNPFSNEPDSRLYKTCDKARYLNDGNIEFLGRLDNQVKIRGFRIELGEIEARLTQHPEVDQAVVVVDEDQPGNKRLVAYIVPTEKLNSIEDLTHKIKTVLRQQLPEYMVPATLMTLSTLPLTPSGKINRRALPPPDSVMRSLSLEMPQTKVEKLIAGVWQKILLLEKVGLDDNFFDMGGNSLLLIKVLQELKIIFTKEISMIEMFQHPSIRSLGQLLSEQKTQTLDTQKSNAERAELRSSSQNSTKRQRNIRQKYRSQTKQ